MPDASLQKIVIAGAGGFVGRALVEKLRTQYEIIALSRSPGHKDPGGDGRHPVEWRQCDLFSLLEAEQGVQGADAGVYLVHSMGPSAHLSQGSFEDFDLILADNFRRAAEKFNLKQIVYVGEFLPENLQKEKSTRHLRSRWEIEDVFTGKKTPATILRAMMILGPEGAGFHIMLRLVQRSLVLVGARWMRTPVRPVGLEDVLKAVSYCLENPAKDDQVYDLGGPDIVSYREMLKKTAKGLGKKRPILNFPFGMLFLSRLWVSFVTGAPLDLVESMIESMRYDITKCSQRLFQIPGHQFSSFDKALEDSLAVHRQQGKTKSFLTPPPRDSQVRSVQRLPLPKDWDAVQVARAYMMWLPKLSPWFVTVEIQKGHAYFSLKWPHLNMLILHYSPERSTPDRQLFYIRGGLLSRSHKKGRLEFREVLDKSAVIAGIHNFRPSLPWYIYRWTQGLVHLWTMIKFRDYLKYKREHGKSRGAVPAENP